MAAHLRLPMGLGWWRTVDGNGLECHGKSSFIFKVSNLEHFSYCCRALKGSLNQAFASSAVSSGSSSAMA